MFKVPERYRVTDHPILGSSKKDGNDGYFKVKIKDSVYLIIIASCGFGWEHVSVHTKSFGKERCPTWDEMCRVKNLFWDEDDCVIQYHPSKSEYVNMHPYTLHLWRPIGKEIPIPPSILVGA